MSLPPNPGNASQPGRYEVVVPTLDHAAGIATVHNDGWRQTFGHLLAGHHYDEAALARRVDFWTRELRQPGADTVMRVAVADGEVIGFAESGPTRGEPAVRERELWILYVAAAWHGAGVAQNLVDTVLGPGPAQLWVVKDNPRAQSFYRRNGFRADGHEQVLDHLDGLVEILMVR